MVKKFLLHCNKYSFRFAVPFNTDGNERFPTHRSLGTEKAPDRDETSVPRTAAPPVLGTDGPASPCPCWWGPSAKLAASACTSAQQEGTPGHSITVVVQVTSKAVGVKGRGRARHGGPGTDPALLFK